MRTFIIAIVCAFTIFSCSKDEVTTSNLNVEGYWEVFRDTTFTRIASNSGSDLFHLFRDGNSFYRLSFLKTHNFSDLSSRPRADSMISFYKVVGNELMLPNASPSITNNVPGNILLSKTNDEMLFTRYIIERRSLIDGSIQKDRTDTIRYVRVTDPAKVSYFNNYLKRFHP